MFCQRCGTENIKVASFCKECGLELKIPVSQPVQQITEKSEPIKESTSNNGIWILIAFLAIVALIAVISYNSEKKENVSDDSNTSVSSDPAMDSLAADSTAMPESSSDATPYTPTKSEAKEVFKNSVSEINEEGASVETEGVKIDLGDINNDGLSDAIVNFSFYSSEGGNIDMGGGLMVLLNNGSKLVADRWFKTNHTTLDYIDENGHIHTEHYEYGENDPRCCPSIRTVNTYKYENGELKEL